MFLISAAKYGFGACVPPPPKCKCDHGTPVSQGERAVPKESSRRRRGYHVDGSWTDTAPPRGRSVVARFQLDGAPPPAGTAMNPGQCREDGANVYAAARLSFGRIVRTRHMVTMLLGAPAATMDA